MSLGEGRSFQGIPATVWGGRNYFPNADLRVAFLLAGVRTIRHELPGIRIANPPNNHDPERKRVPVMDWIVVLIVTAFVAGYGGIGLMTAAFVMVARQGWKQAMQSEPDGRWSFPRCLMAAGVFLGVVFGCAVLLMFLIPGGFSWSEGLGWAAGVAAVALPALIVLWCCGMRQAFASRPNSTAGHQSAQSNAGSEG